MPRTNTNAIAELPTSDRFSIDSKTRKKQEIHKGDRIAFTTDRGKWATVVKVNQTSLQVVPDDPLWARKQRSLMKIKKAQVPTYSVQKTMVIKG